MLFVSYSKKIECDVLNSPASLNYSTRCIVNIARREHHRLHCIFVTYGSFTPTGFRKGWIDNEDVTVPFVKFSVVAKELLLIFIIKM